MVSPLVTVFLSVLMVADYGSTDRAGGQPPALPALQPPDTETIFTLTCDGADNREPPATFYAAAKARMACPTFLASDVGMAEASPRLGPPRPRRRSAQHVPSIQVEPEAFCLGREARCFIQAMRPVSGVTLVR